jgi:alpha-1,2-mannosyltransferase
MSGFHGNRQAAGQEVWVRALPCWVLLGRGIDGVPSGHLHTEAAHQDGPHTRAFAQRLQRAHGCTQSGEMLPIFLLVCRIPSAWSYRAPDKFTANHHFGAGRVLREPEGLSIPQIQRRRPARAACLVLGITACLFGLVVVVRAFWAIPVDLQVYRDGGIAVLNADPLYEGPLAHGLPFTYPPWAAILFTPLALLTPTAAQLAVVIGNCALAIFAAAKALNALSGGSAGRASVALTLVAASVAFAIEAAHTTIDIGQVNLLLLAVILWDLLRTDNRWSKGVGLGIMAGIKLTPLFFVLYLLATKRFRAAIMATGAFLATMAAGFVLLPSDSTRFWIAGTFLDASRVYADAAAPQNQSLHGLILRLDGSATLWLLLAAPVVACTIAVATWASRRGNELIALTLCGLCAATVSPWTWGHHWVWLLPLAVYLTMLALDNTMRPRHAVWLLPAGLMLLTFRPVLALAVPPPGNPPILDAGLVAFILGNVYILIFATILLATIVHLSHLKPRARSGEPTSTDDHRDRTIIG